ncbi:LLM class flavin-dependent oxidoreductase [Streptomyces tsukubensis]|uniref:LLM class flavin-dependent oxidoreductase n=1 Tax=Streptomyces tsukubensis TaxID=83656 RepID=UPI0036BB598D
MRVGTFVLAAQFPGQGRGEALHRAVRTAEVAEESGLDGVWLAEHHFVPYGVCPSAVTLAAVLLGRTRRIRVGTAVSVLPNVHPVALGEQAALLHITSGGRFSLGVGRGGPWIDLEVFGSGLAAYESGFPESLDLLLRWLREPSVGTAGERYRFREVAVVPRPADLLDSALRSAAGGAAGTNGSAAAGTAAAAAAGTGTGADGDGTAEIAGAPDAHPEVVVACTSPGGVRVAAERGLPMLLGMHCGDEEKAEMVALWRRHALAAGHCPDTVAAAGHVSAGVVQIADDAGDAREALLKAMPGWLRLGLGAHRTVDDRVRTMRDPVAYTELLCSLHPVGPPGTAADRLAATAERTGITRFALLAEGSGDLAATETTVRRLGEEVLPLLR